MWISRILPLCLTLATVTAASAQRARGPAAKRPLTPALTAPTSPLLDPVRIYGVPEESSGRWALHAALGTNFYPQASVDVTARAAYGWQHLSLGVTYAMKTGRYSAVRAQPNHEGIDPDPTTFSGEVARPRNDADAWSVSRIELDSEVHGGLLGSRSAELYQVASFGLGLGHARDNANGVSFSTVNVSLGGGVGYRLTSSISAEVRIVYRWAEATAKTEGPTIDRRLPLHWLASQMGIKYVF